MAVDESVPMTRPAAEGDEPVAPGTGDADPSFVELGRQIRAVRRRRGLTLEEVATAAGITGGYLSQIERGLAVPTLASLKRIADSLDVRLADLFQDDGLASPYGLVRHDQRPRFHHALTGQMQTYLTPTWGGRLAAALYRLPPGEATALLFHPGEEFAFVLAGEIEYRIGQRRYRMVAGDSLYFDASEVHQVVNLGAGAAEWLWLATTIP
jgi:transcriptional regulator with XRE-family HTH domain